MKQKLEKHIEGVRPVLMLFLGLNIAWMKTCYNAAVMRGSDVMLDWLPLNWYCLYSHLAVATKRVEEDLYGRACL
mgnify:CR=1 FL=1